MADSGDILGLERVASMATMPSRLAGLEQVLASILPQVSRLFLYLDHFESVPDFLQDNPKITLFRAEECGDRHASSRFLALGHLQKPCLLFLVDDDILYPPDYTATLAAVLAEMGGTVIAGVHGRIFTPPHKSYVRDAMFFNFAAPLPQNVDVHELGAGTCAFVSNLLPLDILSWPSPLMDDLLLSIEAQKRFIRRIAVKREEGWLRPITSNQPDSLWHKTRQDDRVQSRFMRLLLKMY